ncbi:ester hydrolase C11orf54 homolog [Phlebotomus argentipes]|uniref:ester hydrolase C11orf54 homolog n=1 Tax=Phlebotomus argentipes TaxID=94469 RepID=UPI002892B387|nr:ester hydrolase C11orf54 homolog [Phlebotomus argentipes]
MRFSICLRFSRAASIVINLARIMATVSAVSIDKVPFEEKELFVPDAQELKEVLSSGLKKNFEQVSVDFVECPDLSQEPFNLASSGLCGSPTILEYGGAPFLLPLVQRDKLYDLDEICQKVSRARNISQYLVVGAGAGPFPLLGTNCEGVFNLKRNADGTIVSKSHVALVNAKLECERRNIPASDTRSALLGNVYLSEGKRGKILRIHCKNRTGPNNFITQIRETLANHFVEKDIGLGGAFLLKSGKAHQHVMQDFSKTPINTEEQLNSWLKFYDMSAPLVAVGTLVTGEMDMDLRLQHFHSFSSSHWAGHYHYDTTPEAAEYEAYFGIGERIFRIDKPEVTHKFGRD